jgi:alcohol dehydrogenase (NADP+)
LSSLFYEKHLIIDALSRKIMITKAYANEAADKAFSPYKFERREVGPKDVGISIKFCGICHSDIHTARGEWGKAYYPCVPGHEIVGQVSSVGSQVKNYKAGDIVGVGCLVSSCNSCKNCKDGFEQYCEQGMGGTYNSPTPDGGYTKGGYSDYIVVDEHFVFNMPSQLDLAAAAPLLCAGITTYSPLKYVGIGNSSKVAIMGLGGLGHMGVKFAASFGAEVSVLSSSPHKKNDAERLGAHYFIPTSDSNLLKKHANHFDCILDTISAPHDLNQAFNMLKRDGTLIMVGASPAPLDLHVFSLISNRRSILGSLIGGVPETQEMLNHCGKHNIVSEIEVIKANQINEAYERVIKSDVKYRFVIDCSTF